MKLGEIKKCIFRLFPLFLIALWSYPGLATAGPKSMELSQIKLTTPASSEAKEYLGLKEKGAFALSEVKSKFILLGYYGVKCPYCHEQAPISNQIYEMIQKDPDLSKDVKMLGVIVGSTPKDAQSYASTYKIIYPMTNDPFFDIYRKLDKPKVPLTLLIKNDGEILLSVTGAMSDPAGFVKKIKQFDKNP